MEATGGPLRSGCPGRDGKRKKKKGKAEEPEAEKKFIKKKISFRKKAVIEAEDLYDDARARKPRKGAKGKKELAAPETCSHRGQGHQATDQNGRHHYAFGSGQTDGRQGRRNHQECSWAWG